MKNNKEKASPPLITNLIFAIQPLWISLQKPQAQSYFLQFDRASQTIKKYPQIKLSSKTPYVFSVQETEIIKLKILSQHDLNFDWQLFKISDKMSIFVDRIEVNLMEFYRQYVHSIIKKDIYLDKLSQEIKKGDKKVEDWERMKAELQWQFSEIIAKNQQFDIQIGYRLQIWSQFDVWCETQILIRQKSSKLSQLPLEQSVSLEDFQRAMQKQAERQQKRSQSPKYRPKTHKFTMLKRNSLLSEIVQCSNDGSSVINYNERHVQLAQISGISQEDAQSSPFINSGDTFRRNSTIQSKLHAFPQTKRSRSSIQERTYSQDGDKEEGLTQPNSGIDERIKERSEVKGKISMKLVIVAVFCFIFIGYSAYLKISNDANLKQPLKKPTKKQQRAQKSKKPSKKQLPPQQPPAKKVKTVAKK